MSKRGRTPVTHSTLAHDSFGFAFAGGFSPEKGEPLPLIPREEWPREIARAEAEEREWWQGKRVPIQLTVELPFWLMVPDGDISVTYDRATVTAAIRGHYLEVSDGPMFLNSHANVVLIGPGDEVWQRKPFHSLVPGQAPVCRPMKTVVVFQTEAMEDAFAAWKEKDSVAQDDRPGIRRVNRVIHYFESLATAHIPFLNRLITSYRSTSLDPYAFEVSQSDVSVWYAEHEGTLVRIGLMRYWDSDTYPSLNKEGQVSPFYATTLDALQSQAGSDVAPGKLELLDAFSLMYRGRFGDAVRSAVTAIEVALESQLAKLLRRKGHSEEQIANRLGETRNSFHDRLLQYEGLSQKRLPGPLLSVVPYINGIRLRSELDWVRNLRHRVVHEGIRVDVLARGPTLRAVETMWWLFDWLSWEDEHGPEDNRNYIFFSFLRGDLPYPFDYTDTGVVVLPLPRADKDERIETDVELISRQYLDSTDTEAGDLELFSRMSFEYLGVACEDGPPEPADEPKLRERFLIQDGERKAIVFCLEFDGLIDASTAGAVAARVLAHTRLNGPDWSTLAIIHHQRHLSRELREVHRAIPEDVQRIFDCCAITTITVLDLLLIVRGVHALKWPLDAAKDLLFTPGRQGLVPPAYQKVGDYNRYFPKHSAISVQLDEDKTLKVGDTIGLRLPLQYFEQVITSLQVERESVATATGPCKVGITTQLKKRDLRPGQEVFLRIQQTTPDSAP